MSDHAERKRLLADLRRSAKSQRRPGRPPKAEDAETERVVTRCVLAERGLLDAVQADSARAEYERLRSHRGLGLVPEAMLTGLDALDLEAIKASTEPRPC